MKPKKKVAFYEDLVNTSVKEEPETETREQKIVKCKAKVYKLSNKMQRCPYIHEMKERLLGEQIPIEQPKIISNNPSKMDSYQHPVATVVKLNPDGYGSHTSPSHRTDRTPLMPQNEQNIEKKYVDTAKYPKNAKTSLFIIMSFVYAKLLIVICVTYVISDIVTHNIPLYYYEGFFTYLYGMSILFLLYVFCFLLQESTCCSGGAEVKESPKSAIAPKDKGKEKEKEKKKEEEKKKKEEKERQKKEKEKDKDKKTKKGDKREKIPLKMRQLVYQRTFEDSLDEEGTYRRNSEGEVDSAIPVPVAELSAQHASVSQQETATSPPQPPPQPSGPITAAVLPPPTITTDLEAGTLSKRKRKTTHSDQSYGSFFLRIGAIAFGLGTMIYNGLEFGAFFEIPFTSPCYMILRGINPGLQMIFTFMQMYFIFMNSRLNIHRFKVIARFGLMHVVATNICVWIRTLVLEYIKEITIYHRKLMNNTATMLPTLAPFARNVRDHAIRNADTVLGVKVPIPDFIPSTTQAALTTSRYIAPTMRNFFQNMAYTTSTTLRNIPTTIPTTRLAEDSDTALSTLNENTTEILDNLAPQAWFSFNFNLTANVSNTTCGRINIMGNIVQDSGPYLFPFIIEYSLIGAAVIYVMWKHIGRNPRYVTEEDLEHRLEVMLSRRAVAMAHAQQNGRVDCVGASKGLFFGLLMLVASLICLILFFVLIHHPSFGLLAIYLADVSHCVLMFLSIIAIIIGFVRVQHLKFRTEEQTNLNDILLRVSAFGLFMYATFSAIAGHLNAFTKEPNLLVMVTSIMSIVQVILQLLFIGDVARRRVHLPEHDRSKPGRQVVTFLLICNVTMWIIYTFEVQKVEANPVQLEFYGYLTWALVQRFTLPLCIFHRFHSAVALAEIWKTSYKTRLE